MLRLPGLQQSPPRLVAASGPSGRLTQELERTLGSARIGRSNVPRARQDRQIVRLADACRATRHELLLEIIASKHGVIDSDTVARVINHVYDLGVYPDWWKLEPVRTEAAWRKSVEAIERSDPRTRGIVVLGLDAPEEELATSFALAAKFPLVKGFAVGRTIFGDVARAWMRGESRDADAIAEMARRFTRLCGIWDKARATAREAVT